MKNQLFTLFLVLISVISVAQKTGNKAPLMKQAVADRLLVSDEVKVSGFVGGRLDASYQNRILAQDVDRLVAPFRNRTETSCW
ncbi:MAG TPA: hypothetical protein VN249_11250, partial [Prolixibacteraceae bacterium]|nr:hypothetical protein [Prolixibacteraceae bacterium]